LIKDFEMSGDEKNWRRDTVLVRGAMTRSRHKETSEALYLTSGFVYDSAEEAEARFLGNSPGYLYGRYANPTNTVLEDRLRLLEGAEACRLTASGMAAVSASLMCFLRAGDHVVAAKALFASCRWVIETLLPRFGIPCTLVDATDLEAWKAAIRPETKALFAESPTNPNLDVVDIRALGVLAKAAGARLIVDNIFASPIVQRPMELGADIIVYSTTKHMDGQGRTLGGAILADQAYVTDHLDPYLRHTGPAMSPFVAWVVLSGLETLGLRVNHACASAARLADLMANHPSRPRVIYPFRADHPQYSVAKAQMKAGGTLIALHLPGGKAAAQAFLNALQIVDISNNLGDAKSLATHPETTTHYAMSPEGRSEIGIEAGPVRLSVGLEDCDDLAEDLMGALDAAAKAGA
jgi:O-succinylhomoserine sulfhydrylase